LLLAKVVGDTIEYPVDLTQFNDPNILVNYKDYSLMLVVATIPPELPWYKTITGDTAKFIDNQLTQVWVSDYIDDNLIKLEYNKLLNKELKYWMDKLNEFDLSTDPAVTNSNYIAIFNYIKNLRTNYSDYKLVYSPEFAWPQQPQV